MEVEEEETLQCMTHACRKKGTLIKKGDTYYLLGGGTVINCEQCACFTEFTITVNKKPITMQRGWDKTAVVKNIRKIL